MSTENLVLRTVYIDPEVDDQLRRQAVDQHVSKAELFRRYLAKGVKAAKATGVRTPEDPRPTPTLVLHTVHLDPKLDDKLRVQAFDERTSKNDLVRRYLRVGMSL